MVLLHKSRLDCSRGLEETKVAKRKRMIIQDGYYDPFPRERYRYIYDPDPSPPIIAIPFLLKFAIGAAIAATFWKTIVDPMWTDRLIGLFNPDYLKMTLEERRKERDFWTQILTIILIIVIVIVIAWVYTGWVRERRLRRLERVF